MSINLLRKYKISKITGELDPDVKSIYDLVKEKLSGLSVFENQTLYSGSKFYIKENKVYLQLKQNRLFCRYDGLWSDISYLGVDDSFDIIKIVTEEMFKFKNIGLIKGLSPSAVNLELSLKLYK